MKRTLTLAAAAMLSAGCTTAEIRDAWRAKAGPHKVAYTGNGITLGEVGKPAVAPDAFVRRATELLAANRQFSAEQYVLRYPDVASEVLKLPQPGTSPEVGALITRVLGDRRLRQNVESGLKQSESLRQANQAQNAAAAWSQAAKSAAELLDRRPTMMDPAMWERLAALRPVEANWPPEVQASLARAAAGIGLVNPEGAFAECLLWAVVGRWHFERNEAHAAVAALKRAEVLTTDPALKDRLRILQAQALVTMGQESTASSILVSLTSHENPAIAGPALATLGAVKLHGGAAQQARPLLEKALATPDVWPGRPEAMGDLALAMLMLANEQAGVEGLHAAQYAFQSAGDTRGLLRAMHNEAEYWVVKGAEPRAAEVRGRMSQVEQGTSQQAPVVQPAVVATQQKPELFTMPFESKPRPR